MFGKYVKIAIIRYLCQNPNVTRKSIAQALEIPRTTFIVLAAAVAGGIAPFERLLGILRDPFTERTDAASRRFAHGSAAEE